MNANISLDALFEIVFERERKSATDFKRIKGLYKGIDTE